MGLIACKLLRRAARNIAARSCGSKMGRHEVALGGPRGIDPGNQVSMQIIRPCLQSGQSHSDTPVSRS